MPTTRNEGGQQKSSAMRTQTLSNASIQPNLFLLAGLISENYAKQNG
jgi:hypothetical protein